MVDRNTNFGVVVELLVFLTFTSIHDPKLFDFQPKLMNILNKIIYCHKDTCCHFVGNNIEDLFRVKVNLQTLVQILFLD